MWSSTFCGESDHNHLIATNKPTMQSSTADGGISARAVDYSHKTAWKEGTCTKTEKTEYPWWQVDLQRVYNVTSAVLWTSDEFSEWMVNIRVLVCNDADCSEDVQECAHPNKYPSGPGEALSRRCHNGGILGRYLRLQSTMDDAALCLCEVMVYGRKFPGLHTIDAAGHKECRTVTDQAGLQCCADSAVAISSSSDILTLAPLPHVGVTPAATMDPTKLKSMQPGSRSPSITVQQQTSSVATSENEDTSNSNQPQAGMSNFVMVAIGAASAFVLSAILAVSIVYIRRHQEERMARSFREMNDLGSSPSRSRESSDVDAAS
jgi:hypothetical protein